jgi:hypothetical protein
MADNKKRRQHYVWREYLESWTVDEKIWCRRGDSIFATDVMNVGQQRDFYRLKELSGRDIDWIKGFVAKGGSDLLRKTNMGWIESFDMIFRVKRFVEKNKLSNPELEKELDVQINNFEENLHMMHEDDGIKYLSRLLDRDTSFFRQGLDVLGFSHFLSLQHMRTKRMEQRIAAQFANDTNVNMQAVWPVLRHVTSLNIASSIYNEREKFRLVLLENASEVGFITGDQPVINTYAVRREGLTPVSDHEFYYPVSADIAILLTDRGEYRDVNSVLLDKDRVEWFNRAIYDMSHEQIYGNSEAAVSCF